MVWCCCGYFLFHLDVFLVLKYQVLLAVCDKHDCVDFEIWKGVTEVVSVITKHCAGTVSVVLQVLLADFFIYAAVMSHLTSNCAKL